MDAEVHTVGLRLAIWGFLFLSEFGILRWKQNHPRSFHVVTLILLWLVPVIFLAYSLRMMLIWITFSGRTIYFIRKSKQNPLPKNTCRQVYSWFATTHKVCLAMASGGAAILFINFYALRHAHVLLNIDLAATLLAYGLYFGVLGRDCAEVCAANMASNMGYICCEDSLPRRRLDPNICGICGERLYSDVDKQVPIEQLQEVYTLNCKHPYHEFCIRGWTIIGKKDTCPVCAEKVNLQETFTNPWQKQNIIWASVLDMTRYLVAWIPVIVLSLRLLLYLA